MSDCYDRIRVRKGEDIAFARAVSTALSILDVAEELRNRFPEQYSGPFTPDSFIGMRGTSAGFEPTLEELRRYEREGVAHIAGLRERLERLTEEAPVAEGA